MVHLSLARGQTAGIHPHNAAYYWTLETYLSVMITLHFSVKLGLDKKETLWTMNKQHKTGSVIFLEKHHASIFIHMITLSLKVSGSACLFVP